MLVKDSFFLRCKNIILENDILAKCNTVEELYIDWNNGIYTTPTPTQYIEAIHYPGRPAVPLLVPPLEVPKRKVGTQEGVARLIHALAHIEFNAINLAIDDCYRYQDMPLEYYSNWLQVAKEEVLHFQLLEVHLREFGFYYGSFTAHNGLWDMAIKTDGDVLLRMALVHRVLEARGIDAIPEIIPKLAYLNNAKLIESLNIIHKDEIKHVCYGDYWFKYLCKMRDVDPETTFLNLLEPYNAPKIRGAFDWEGRRQAGFSEAELAVLCP